MILPVLLTAMLVTYLDAAEVTSQPQEVGNALPVVDWMTSVTEVRQPEAARTISETFALTV